MKVAKMSKMPHEKVGTVVSVNISREKGTVKHPVEKIILNQHGIEHDAHAGTWHRQVSLLAYESVEKFSKGTPTGRKIKSGEFAENILTKGLDLTEFAPLDKLTIGDVELEVTQIGKKCHGDGCAIYREVGNCVMPKEGIFARVVKGGEINPEDEIRFTPRPFKIRVITLSDRASQGEYEDKSGPALVDILHTFFATRRWHEEIETTIIPDDEKMLEDNINDAVNSGAKFVFTTGGTGIGPRDITPDVVGRMADKMIPGIMDHIRLKYGQDKPSVLLSRSVAAVIQRTVVFTLPGSVKAVNEYMTELTKSLDHIFYMLNQIDQH
jgi:molybdopterin adenylyltransferase